MNFDNAYKKPLCRFSVEQENGVHQAFDCAKALYLAAEQECYRTLSRTEMAAFLDAAAYAAASPTDGVHMEPEGHRALGEAIAEKIQEIFS